MRRSPACPSLAEGGVYRLRDGRISEHRAYFDTGTMMRQLGLMP